MYNSLKQTILECAITHVLCQHFSVCNNGCDDSSDIFPLLLPVASSESWTDSYEELVSFFFGDNLMLQWNTVNNWSSYSIKWKVKFFKSLVRNSSVCFLLLWKYTITRNAACGGMEEFISLYTSWSQSVIQGKWSRNPGRDTEAGDLLFSPYGLLILLSYTTYNQLCRVGIGCSSRLHTLTPISH